jgi:hypothetical protein
MTFSLLIFEMAALSPEAKQQQEQPWHQQQVEQQ